MIGEGSESRDPQGQAPDLSRLRRTMGQPALGPLIDRLRRRFEAGRRDAVGAVRLAGLSREQREAIDSLLGRRPSTGEPLVLRLAQLEAVVRGAGLAPTLCEAVEAVVGPIPDRREQRERQQARWAELFGRLREQVGSGTRQARWIEDLQRTGLLMRLSGRDARRAADWMSVAVEVAGRLPHAGTTRARLAAQVTGDAHGLDRGMPLATLLAPWVQRLSGVPDLRSAGRFRRAWERVGVAGDELSSSVLVLNLPASGDSALGRMLRDHAEQGVPCRVMLRGLLRESVSWDAVGPGAVVSVCENPSVVAAAADALGRWSRPLVCLEGQPSTAGRLLLGGLRRASVALRYHGDFDWPGVRIGGAVVEQWGARPWRFGVEAYRAAVVSAKLPLRGVPVAAGWDRDLLPAMQAAGLAVHEEQVIQTLLDDLDGGVRAGAGGP